MKHSPIELDALLKLAKVPEHSVAFMQAVSGGVPFIQKVENTTDTAEYLCFHADDWLTLIGYPLRGTYSHQSFLQAKKQALAQCQATQCFAIGPQMPPLHQEHIQEHDVFYTLPATSAVPPKLRRIVKKAQGTLRLEQGRQFTPEHRRLWTEFLGRKMLAQEATENVANSTGGVIPSMTPMVKKLFMATPTVLQAPNTDLRLLNAWDEQGHLAATLLVDFAPKAFSSYILGAHSRAYYTPHAADALFAFMLELSRLENKDFLHLGLSVNDGITRFKKKWGGQATLPFVRAAWQEGTTQSVFKQDMQSLLLAAVGVKTSSQQEDLHAFVGQSKRQIFASFPEQRPYAMLWKIQKGSRTSWIGGAAHFFCYSFERSFRALFDHVEHVLFEGPLDAQSLQIVEAEGKTITPTQQPLLTHLQEHHIRRLERCVRGPEGWWARLLNMQAQRRVDVRWYLAHARPWSALFTLWTGFLERQGWQQSVDLEAWNIAHDMAKNVVAMESLEEQLASLNAVPAQRVVHYFQNCHHWPRMIKQNVKAYLRGDLLQLMGTSAEFPTRTHTIINERDERFRRRMRPFLEEGRAAVFVGTAHMLNLRNMLAEDGFTVTQVYPTLSHKLRALYKLRS